MSDAQNLPYKPLAVTFGVCNSPTSILQKKAFGELCRVIPFPVVHSMDAEVMLILTIKRKCEGTLLVLLLFWRSSCFFQKGQSSGITITDHSDSLVLGSKRLCWYLFWLIVFGRFLQPDSQKRKLVLMKLTPDCFTILFNFWKVNTRLLTYHTGWNRLSIKCTYHCSWPIVETTKR